MKLGTSCCTPPWVRALEFHPAFIGYYLSTVPGIENEEQLLAKVTEYSHEIGYVFIGIGVLIVAFFIYKGMKKK